MKHVEYEEQAYFVRWLRVHRILFCASTGGSLKCDIRQGSRIKRAGYEKGHPDIMIYVARGAYHGLAIEMKTKKGRCTPEQKEYLARLRDNGYYTAVCHGAQKAIDITTRYLRGELS